LMALRAGTAAPVCRDEWTGTSSYRIKTPGQSASYVAATATITWEYDPAASAPGVTAYRASGTFDLEFGTPAAGCTITLSPRSFAIAANPLTTQNLWIYDTGAAPPTYTFLGSQMVTTTSTYSCPGKEDVVTHLDGLLVSFGPGGGTFAPGQSVLSGATDDGAIETAWHFARP
ncbi:MAG: hypothetical protein R2882_13270, partial [Gemmatimonadales bacterium]